jgi:MoaA/NifB/PqqE/SkfB family radical SAM enzyme
VIYRPLNGQIEVTMRCNARCVFCSIWQKDYQKNLDPEMTTEEIKHVIDGFSKLHVLIVTFTGGEPLLRTDLPQLLDYAKSKKIVPAIATNGYYLYDWLKAGKLNAVEWIMVSIDWPDPSHHNDYRKLEVYERALQGIRAAVLEKKQTLISMVVTKENIGQMEEMCKLAFSLGCMIEMLPCEDIIREQEENDFAVQEINHYLPDLHQWADEIRRLVQIYPNVITDTGTAAILEAGGFGYQNLLHCVASEAYINVRYNGEMVFPCKIHPILRVNVKERSPYDVYYSKEAREIMDKKDSFPFCKGCRLGCAVAASIPTRLDTLYEKYVRAFFNGNFF